MTAERKDSFVLAAQAILGVHPDGSHSINEAIQVLEAQGLDGHDVRCRRRLELHLRDIEKEKDRAARTAQV